MIRKAANGAEIILEKSVGEGRTVVLAETERDFVTWSCFLAKTKREYFEWGYYFPLFHDREEALTEALADYKMRRR